MSLTPSWKQQVILDVDWTGDGIYYGRVEKDISTLFHERMPKGAALRDLKDVHLHLAYWETPYYRKAITRFLKENQPCQNTIVMDVGCGDGRFTELLVELGYERIIATDAHLTPLLSLQDYAQRKGFADRLLIIHCDADAIPLRTGVAAAILAIGVYYYLNNRYENCLLEARRLLKTGGVLINSEPDLEGAVYKSLIFEEPRDGIENLQLKLFKEEKGNTDFKFRLFSREEYPQILERNGFKTLDSHGLSLLPSIIRIKMVRGEFDSQELKIQEQEIRELLDYFDEYGSLHKHIIWKSVVSI
jgi:SAM-dependent methyltransferase